MYSQSKSEHIFLNATCHSLDKLKQTVIVQKKKSEKTSKVEIQPVLFISTPRKSVAKLLSSKVKLFNYSCQKRENFLFWNNKALRRELQPSLHYSCVGYPHWESSTAQLRFLLNSSGAPNSLSHYLSQGNIFMWLRILKKLKGSSFLVISYSFSNRLFITLDNGDLAVIQKKENKSCQPNQQAAS